jgi:hypothetical protein
MPAFDPELIRTMNAVLEEAMSMVPLERASTGMKAYLAECILKAAAQGVTSYDSLMAAAVSQLPNFLSMFS